MNAAGKVTSTITAEKQEDEDSTQLVTTLFKEKTWGSILYLLISCTETERQETVLLFDRIVARLQGRLIADCEYDTDDPASQLSDGCVIGLDFFENNPLANFEELEAKEDVGIPTECKEAKQPIETMDDLIERYFTRFDLDGSGTINRYLPHCACFHKA